VSQQAHQTFLAVNGVGTWHDTQGVGLTGKRVVLLSVALLDPSPDDEALGSLWSDLMTVALDQARGN
jgi:hypothetical protein